MPGSVNCSAVGLDAEMSQRLDRGGQSAPRRWRGQPQRGESEIGQLLLGLRSQTTPSEAAGTRVPATLPG